MGSVLHVHAQWVTPSPVPGGAIGQSLKGSVLSNIRKLFTKQALKRSEQKFCYKMKSCHWPCLGSVLHVHAQWVTPSPVPGGAIGQGLEGGLLSNIRKLFTKQALERSEQKFCYKIKSCPTPWLGSVLHVHAQWVTPSPVPGGAIGQSLKGSVLSNIRKLLGPKKECTTCPCPMGYPQLGPRGAIGQGLEGGLLSNIRKLFTKQALEKSEQNFVTKLNHVPHLAWGLYCMSMPNGLPPVQSQGEL